MNLDFESYSVMMQSVNKKTLGKCCPRVENIVGADPTPEGYHKGLGFIQWYLPGRVQIVAKPTYQMHPVVQKKLLGRLLEYAVLKAIFEHQNSCKSLMKLPKHPSTWGWVVRAEIAHRMGFRECNKTLSRKIRKSFLWLEEKGYLKHFDVNKVGNNKGATRFLIAFWILKVVVEAAAGVLLGLKPKDLRDTSRTFAITPKDWKPDPGMAQWSRLVTA